MGYMAGSIADDKDRERGYSADDLALIPRGSAVEVRVDSGAVLRGTFLGTVREDAGKYAVRFDEWRTVHDSGHVIPRLYDTVCAGTPHQLDMSLSGIFIGFDPGAILVQRIDKRDTVNLWAPSIVLGYDSRGNTIDWAAMRSLVRAGKPPFFSSLVLATGDGKRTLALGTITSVTLPASTYRKWVGLGVGIAIDAALVVYLWSRFGFGLFD